MPRRPAERPPLSGSILPGRPGTHGRRERSAASRAVVTRHLAVSIRTSPFGERRDPMDAGAGHCSSSPFGHRTSSRSTLAALPSPKWTRRSFCEIVAAAAADLLNLRDRRRHSRTRAPIALRFDRVPISCSVIQSRTPGPRDQQVGRVVDVVDDDVDVAVVVDIREGGAAAGVRRGNRRPEPFADVFERPFPRLR